MVDLLDVVSVLRIVASGILGQEKPLNRLCSCTPVGTLYYRAFMK